MNVLSTIFLLALLFAFKCNGNVVVVEEEEEKAEKAEVRDLLNRRQAEASVRIINGKDAKDGEFPWMISLQREYQGKFYHFCGGSLIHPRYILTAGHCIKRGTKPDRIVYGTNDLDKVTSNNIATVNRVQPSFYPGYGTTMDVALLKLNKPINGVPLMVLDDGSDSKYVAQGQKVEVSGWGYTDIDKRQVSNELQVTTVPLVDNTQCQKNDWYGGRIFPNNICAGSSGNNKNPSSGNSDSCNGDSGGPLFHSNGDQAVQVGIVSWGRSCGIANQYGVYTRVNYAQIYNWIKGQVGELATPLPYSQFKKGGTVNVGDDDDDGDDDQGNGNDNNGNNDNNEPLKTTRKCSSIQTKEECCQHVFTKKGNKYSGDRCVPSAGDKYPGRKKVGLCQPEGWVLKKGYETADCPRATTFFDAEEENISRAADDPSLSSPSASAEQSPNSFPEASVVCVAVAATVLLTGFTVFFVRSRRNKVSLGRQGIKTNPPTPPSSSSSSSPKEAITMV